MVCRHALRYPTDLDGLIGEAILLDPPWCAAIFRKHPRLARVLRAPRMALVHADRRLRDTVRALSLPLLLLQGSDDAMAPPSGSEYLHRYAGSRDRTLLVFEGGDHDLVNGRCHRRVREKTGQWIEAQLAPGSRRRIGIEYINEEA
ncbi:alpha/beta hydrolase [Pseudoxanthomonas sp. PXM02]|nr:alpha/beta hydrolase [Pseudoxanthomonas sp. PXM02]